MLRTSWKIQTERVSIFYVCSNAQLFEHGEFFQQFWKMLMFFFFEIGRQFLRKIWQ